jgi:hypothetical protein
MNENKERREAQERSRCQIGHVPGKPSSPCAEVAKVDVDGVFLCEEHALETKLEGQISCWEEMLFHIELWSREAASREREDVMWLLEDQRVQALSARHRAYEELGALRRSETPLGEVSSAGGWELLSRVRRSSLPLPPKAARPPFLGLRRLRRR